VQVGAAPVQRVEALPHVVADRHVYGAQLESVQRGFDLLVRRHGAISTHVKAGPTVRPAARLAGDDFESEVIAFAQALSLPP
jgi:hypothetical protein